MWSQIVYVRNISASYVSPLDDISLYVSSDVVDFANVYGEHIMTRVTESRSFFRVLILMFGT